MVTTCTYVVCLLLLATALTEARDKTRITGTSGAEVVDAVVNRIRESCLFPDDRLFIRRLAYVATRDGGDAGTYRPLYDGGIWQIDKTMFKQTQTSSTSSALFPEIRSQFGIDWSSVPWRSLRKPLFSGLAAALYLTTLPAMVPASTKEQAHFYSRNFRNDSKSVDRFTDGAKTFDIVCGRTNLDLAFLVDASSSLSPEDFIRAKQFAHKVVNNFLIGRNEVRVAFVTFSTSYKSVFDFNKHTEKDELLRAIDGVLKSEGRTETDKALDFASEQLFTESMGSREGSSKVILLITDGKSSNSFRTIPAALRARNKGIVIFAIGVGSDVDGGELKSLANKPQCTHVMQLKGYSGLNSLVSQMQQVSCRAPVVLEYGTYTFSCSVFGLYQIIYIGNTTQITVTTTAGKVNIYGSSTNPTPSQAGHILYRISTSSEPAVIVIRQQLKNFYLNVTWTAGRSDPCRGNYTIKVGAVHRVEPDTKVTCLQYDVSRSCSVAEIFGQLYNLLSSPYEFPNPCRPGSGHILKHPVLQTQFILCDSHSRVFVFECPLHHVYNPLRQECVPGEPSTTTSTSSTTSTTTRNSITSTSTTSTSMKNDHPMKTRNTQTTLTPTYEPSSSRATTSSSSFTSQTSTLPSAKSSMLSTTSRRSIPSTKSSMTSISARRSMSSAKSPSTVAVNSPTSTFKLTITTSAPETKPTARQPHSHSNIINPCTKENAARGEFLFAYPQDDTKFIECTNFHPSGYIKQCDRAKIWKQQFHMCIFKFVVIDPISGTVDNIRNPCMEDLAQGDQFYYPHPSDRQKYIQCDQYGEAYEMSCPSDKAWHQHLLQCVREGLIS